MSEINGDESLLRIRLFQHGMGCVYMWWGVVGCGGGEASSLNVLGQARSVLKYDILHVFYS